MRAVVYERYGPPDVLSVREVDEPEPAAGQLLIKVRAASINRSDWETLTGKPAFVRLSGAGFLRPKNPTLGSDIAGTVEAIGPGVTQFKPGDQVLGDIMWHGARAFAEYVVVPESAPLVAKPAGMSFVDAAAIPQAGVLALQGLRKGRETQQGDRVLIVGAGGGGGSFAVQLAKVAGAHVTAVDNSIKLARMRELGADEVIDYTQADFARRGETHDRILDFAGRRSIFANRRVLNAGGVYGMVGGTVPRLLQAATVGWILSRGSRSMGVLLVNVNRDDLARVVELVAEGTITASIERTYPLEEVPAALRQLGENRAIGKLVITM